MKTIGWLMISLSVVCLGIGSAYGTSFVIDDSIGGATSYWGGKLGAGHTDQDVLGAMPDGGSYDFSRMEVTFTGSMMKVQIFGDFTKSLNRGGDLFLSSTGWRAFGTGPHHIGDTFTQNEGWDYVVSSSLIPDPPGGPPAYRGIWKLDWTSLFWTSEGRTEQAYNKDAGGVKVGDVSVTFANESLTFEFDYTKLGSLGPNSFGLHFTQSCGNDVIEGGTPVPEPSTLLLLGFGLGGLGMIKMRRKAS